MLFIAVPTNTENSNFYYTCMLISLLLNALSWSMRFCKLTQVVTVLVQCYLCPPLHFNPFSINQVGDMLWNEWHGFSEGLISCWDRADTILFAGSNLLDIHMYSWNCALVFPFAEGWGNAFTKASQIFCSSWINYKVAFYSFERFWTKLSMKQPGLRISS